MKQELYVVKAFLCGALAFVLMCCGFLIEAFVRALL
jgi:hypothetical protein